MSNGFDSMKCQKRLSFDCSIFHVGNMKQKKKSCWTLVLYFIFPLILKVEPPQAIKHKIWEIKITLFFGLSHFDFVHHHRCLEFWQTIILMCFVNGIFMTTVKVDFFFNLFYCNSIFIFLLFGFCSEKKESIITWLFNPIKTSWLFFNWFQIYLIIENRFSLLWKKKKPQNKKIIEQYATSGVRKIKI